MSAVYVTLIVATVLNVLVAVLNLRNAIHNIRDSQDLHQVLRDLIERERLQ